MRDATHIKVDGEQVDLMQFPVKELIKCAKAFDKLSLRQRSIVPLAFLNTLLRKDIVKCECSNWYCIGTQSLLDLTFRPVIMNVEDDEDGSEYDD